MSEKLKKIFLIISILIIFVILVIFIIINTLSKTKKIDDNEIVPDEIEGFGDVGNEAFGKDSKFIKIEDMAIYNIVQNKMNKYINDCYEKSSDLVLDVLDEEYVLENNITKDNIFQKIVNIDNYCLFDIEEAKQYNLYGNYAILVTGRIKSKDQTKYDSNKNDWVIEKNNNGTNQKQSYFIKLNFENMDYSIKPITEENLNDIVEKNDITEVKVTKNNNNVFVYKEVKNDQIISKYILQFKTILNEDSSKIYDLLDDEYKKAKFSTMDEFNKYIKDNYENFMKMNLYKYSSAKKDDYKEYIFIDTYDNYYIIKETAAMEYKILLDPYTIKIDSSMKKYEKSNGKEKAEICIGYIKQALNNRDYKYIYSHLNSDFRNQNFKSINELQEYIEKNFYKKNGFELIRYDEQNDMYIYLLKLKNLEDSSQDKQFKISLRLLNNGEYEILMSI